MAQEIHIGAPRPGLITLSASAVCIGAAGLLLVDPSPEGLDAASIAYLSASLLTFMVGLSVMFVAVSNLPLRPIHTVLLTELVAATSIAALMLAPPVGRLQPAGTPASVHDLVSGRPKPKLLFMHGLPPAGSPEVARLAVVGHLESLIASNLLIGSPREAVPGPDPDLDPVSACPMPSFVSTALIGSTEDIEDMLSICPVLSLPNIVLLPLFCEPGIRGNGPKEVI